MAITKTNKKWNADLQAYEILGDVVTYVGKVIKVFHEDYRAMSDVYTLATFARVLDDDGLIRDIMVNANFECDISGGRAEVDATPETLAAFAAHNARIEADRKAYEKAQREAFEAAERNRPVLGKPMEVFKGRKVPVGTQGTVAFIHNGSGNVLLKPDHCWKDRKANGVWVNPANLRARA